MYMGMQYAPIQNERKDDMLQKRNDVYYTIGESRCFHDDFLDLFIPCIKSAGATVIEYSDLEVTTDLMIITPKHIIDSSTGEIMATYDEKDIFTFSFDLLTLAEHIYNYIKQEVKV